MTRTIEEAEARIQQLERLVSSIRHDIRGAITPVLLIADRLCMSAEPKVVLAGEKIGASIERVTKLLNTTRDLVPSAMGSTRQAPAAES